MPPVKPATARSLHLIDRPGAVQSSLWLGLPVIDATHKDFLPLAVTNAIVGGAFSSRITSNIRENKGYTYSPRSAVTPLIGASLWAEVVGDKATVKKQLAPLGTVIDDPPASK